MSFNTLSEVFRESLDQMAEDLRQKKLKKEAQLAGGAPVGGAPAVPGPDPKEQQVNEVLQSIQQFNDRLTKEWLYSKEDSDLQEVKRVFDEINQLSAGEIQQLMGNSTPFEFVGSMIKDTPGDTGGKPCCGGDAEVVAEIEIPMEGLNHSPNHGHTEGLPGSIA